MSAPPYMKLYVADYLGDTHHLGALEHGAYLLLLMAMWRAGGSLPAADVNLAKIARCTPDEWAAVKPVIMPFFQRSRSRLTHKRVAEEMGKYDVVSRQRSEAGKRGARQKAIENKVSALAIAAAPLSNCTHNQNQNHKEGSEDKSSGADGAVREDFDATAWTLAVRVLTTQGTMTDVNARKFIGRILRDTGIEARDILPSLTQAMVSGTGDPQGYIRRAAERVAKRRAPAERQRVGFV